MVHLKQRYQEVVVPGMLEQFRYANVMQIPKIQKVTLNMGLKDAVKDNKALDAAVLNLKQIAGQAPVVTRATKSIAGFKLPKGAPVGCMVTLRGDLMYEFLTRLQIVALPRVRDFRGLSPKSFDGRGNYAMGLKEQIVFPEVDYDKVDRIRGLDVVIVTTAPTDDEARHLLKLIGFPFLEQ